VEYIIVFVLGTIFGMVVKDRVLEKLEAAFNYVAGN